MNTSKQNDNINYTISKDIILEVLEILIYAGLNYKIIEIQNNQSAALISIHSVGDTKFQQEALKNIYGIVQDYDFFRRHENEEVNWRGK